MVKVDVKNRRITGYVRNNHGGVPDNFHNYFVAEFDRDFTLARTWAGDDQPTNALSREGDHVGAVLSFKTKKDDKVHVRVASSFISPEQALLNLRTEIGSDSFDTTHIGRASCRERVCQYV